LKLKCPLWVPVGAQAQQNGHGIVRAADKTKTMKFQTGLERTNIGLLLKSPVPAFFRVFLDYRTKE